MNAFQLERGYSLSIVGIPRKIFTQDLIGAHMDRESLHAVERMMGSNTTSSTDEEFIPEVKKVIIYH